VFNAQIFELYTILLAFENATSTGQIQAVIATLQDWSVDVLIKYR